jgi:hypothetical protein
MKSILPTLLYLLTSCSIFGQDTDSLFSRLHGISNNGVDFFNVDGFEITSQKIESEFSKKSILKKFKRFSIKELDLTSSDSTLGFTNFYVRKSKEEPIGIFNNITYYFIESSDKKLIGLTFASLNKSDKELERKFVSLVRMNAIPKFVYSPLQIDSINFANRKIPLGGSCRWMGINNVQCPYYGQMNWSVHKSFADASQTVDNHFAVLKVRKGGKIVSDSTVDVIFEGIDTKAKKIVYDFTGLTSALVSMTGGKTLTVFFVAAPVRNNFISCVMSFWNNDSINPSGLPPLLEKVMKLK